MRRLLVVFALLSLLTGHAKAQSNPGFYYGFVPTPAQWNSYFSAKADLNAQTQRIQIGTLPFATASSYTAGAANSSLLAVRGSFSNPVSDQQAVGIFQATRNSTGTSGTTPALYASTVKIGSGSGIINQAGQFEAIETAGNGGVSGIYTSGYCTQASLGNCQGSTNIAVASVLFSTLIGAEGVIINNSGNNATTTFSSTNFASGLMATCSGANGCDAGVLTNPSNVTKAVSGFLVTAASVSDTAFRNDASLVNGFDGSRGAYSGSFLKGPGNFSVNGSGGMVLGVAAPTVAAGQIGYGGTTVAAGSGTCPSGTVGGQTVQGCIVVNIAGTSRNVPFF